MKKFIPYIILAALVGVGVLAQNFFSTLSQPTITVTDSQTVQPATHTPTAAPSSGQCAYMWAYHDADELSVLIDAEVRAIDSAASGHASFYGEDCVYADGHSTFSAMETDFYVHIPVADLTDEKSFGNWIAQVLKVVLEFPREQIQGNYGFVEFWFEKSESEHVIVRVPIQQYINNTSGVTGAALFRMFHNFP